MQQSAYAAAAFLFTAYYTFSGSLLFVTLFYYRYLSAYDRYLTSYFRQAFP